MSDTTRINGLDMSDFTIDQLQELRDAVEHRLRVLEDERREAGFQALEEIAHQHGLSKTEVAARFGGKRGKAPRSAPKYRDPDDPSQTWTGRGRRPKWVEDRLARGGALEDLAI